MAIIAFDFDGTVCNHKFPSIGEELPGAIATLKALQENGHKLFLWTMRGHPDLSRFPHTDKDTGEYIEQDTLQEALDWLAERGLTNIGVNKSPAQFSTSLKQYAQVYIDDAAVGCPMRRYFYGNVGVDWQKIAYQLMNCGLLTGIQFNVVSKEVERNSIGPVM